MTINLVVSFPAGTLQELLKGLEDSELVDPELAEPELREPELKELELDPEEEPLKGLELVKGFELENKVVIIKHD